jgi:molybdate transport system substrate-binding protein
MLWSPARRSTLVVALLCALATAVLALAAARAAGAEVRVMISGGYATTLTALAPAFEKESGNKIIAIRGPSMGETPEAIPNRLRRGEAADVLIMVDSALDGLIHVGKALADTSVDLARSGIGVAVREDAPRPDIASVEALKRTLLAARTIAYSDSASGVYLSTVLFPKLGIAEAIRDKSKMIPGEPVGAVVARGDAELGFQQMSELKPIHGIVIVGPLPEGAQKYTVFSGAVASAAQKPEAARALLRFLATSPAASATAIENGLMPPGN